MPRSARLLLTAALLVFAGAAPAAAQRADQSSWPLLCVNPNQADWTTGRPYDATPADKANCRVLDAVGTDQRDRRFVVVAPASALRRPSTPVVYFFHGTGGTGEQWFRISRWRELAHRFGFVAVFPTALGFDLNSDASGLAKNVFNVIGQDCDLVTPGQLPDDVAYVRAIHADLTAHLRVDARRVYAAGFSNGGQMVHRLAAEAGDIFAAGGAWAGMPAEACATDPARRSADPAPVWNGMGSEDDRYTGEREIELPISRPRLLQVRLNAVFGGAATVYGTQRVASRRLAIGDLARVPRVRGSSVRPVWSDVLAFDRTRTAGPRAQYLFVLLDDLGHAYPNAWPTESRSFNESKKNVAMASLHLQWFLDNPK